MANWSNKIDPGFICDVLAGERGPSCQNIQHDQDLKLIHIRFIQMFHRLTEEETYEKVLFSDNNCEIYRYKYLLYSTGKLKLRVHSEKQKNKLSFHWWKQSANITTWTVIIIDRYVGEKREREGDSAEYSLSKMVRL